MRCGGFEHAAKVIFWFPGHRCGDCLAAPGPAGRLWNLRRTARARSRHGTRFRESPQHPRRWTSTIVAILGIAGTVGVFVAMLSLARGFKATLVASGSPGTPWLCAPVLLSEQMGGITLDSIRVIQDKPGIAREGSVPLVTQEVVGVMPFPLITTGTDANVQVRGVSPTCSRFASS